MADCARAERLEELAAAMPDQQVDCMPLDLCDPMSFMTLQEKLASEQPEVALLVNNAGCGYLGMLERLRPPRRPG